MNYINVEIKDLVNPEFDISIYHHQFDISLVSPTGRPVCCIEFYQI